METFKTGYFDKWLNKLNSSVRVRIDHHLRRAANEGFFGDHQGIEGAEQISEMRLFFGPGYRLYYSIWENTVLLLLVGGDKSTQRRDIERAKFLLPGAVAAVQKMIEEKKHEETESAK